MRWYNKILFAFTVLLIIYILGPAPETPVYNTTLPALASDLKALEESIKTTEAFHKVKPENEATIVWANDTLKQKTEYSIVYLPGFTASQKEGDPVHKEIAKKFGCNLYLSRLAEHGLDTIEPLINLTAEKYWQSAKEAYAIGKQLGNKVILMSTSTGGTLSLKLAATFPDIYATILLSPNIEINNSNAWLLNNHWGLQIARMVTGSKYIMSKDQRDIYKKYWYSKYRLEGAVALQELMETSMNKKTFNAVTQPTLLLYYFKDNEHQDNVVKVGAMLNMFDALNTPINKKRKHAIPNAGDHVIGSSIKSNDVETVNKEIENFFIEILEMKIVK